jgi:MFS transporter, DHA2 family, multidrug resistance protein
MRSGVTPALAAARSAGDPARTRPNPWAVAVTVALTTFMEVLDMSIANVALAHIAGDLGAGQDEATWVLTSYLVSNAIVLPISGWVATMYGRRRFYMGCVAVFTVSSFLCGIAPSLWVLIVARVLQGAGGGGLQPSSQAILSDTFPPAKRGMAFAVYGITTVMAPAIGPTLGGWITDSFDWRWIFFINIPVGLLSLALSSRLVFDPPALQELRATIRRRGFRIDYVGFALLTVGFGALQILLDKGEREDWFDSTMIVSMAIASVVALVAWVWWELRQQDPIVDLRLLKSRNFLVANVYMFFLGFVLLGSTALLPMFVQSLMGYTATDAGLMLSPGGLSMLLFMPLVGAMVTRVDVRWMVVFGFVVSGAALLLLTRIDLQVDFGTLVLLRMLQTAGLAFLFIPINTAAFADIPMTKSTNASSIINLSRNLGGSFGISLITTWLARRTQVHQSVLASDVTGYSARVGEMLDGLARNFVASGSSLGEAADRAKAVLYGMLQKQASMLAFVDCYWILGVIFLSLAPFVFVMRRPRPVGPSSGAH